MSDHIGVFSRVVTRIRALLPEHWRGHAGKQFRKTADEISEFVDNNDLRLGDVAEEAVVLGRRKLHGIANKEYAAALKDFADVEQTKIEIELQRRSLESKVRKEEAEATLAELQVLDAQAELIMKLKKIGVTLQPDKDGNYTVLPAPKNFSLKRLNELLPESDGKGSEQ
jgi:hypothetical protein